MRRTTLETIVKLMGVASTDLTRAHLCTVRIEVNDAQDSLTLVATDGHKLASVNIEDDVLYNAIKAVAKPYVLIETSDKSMLQAALKYDIPFANDDYYKTKKGGK